MSVALKVDGVSLAFGGVQALRDVSFTVKPGQIFAIIGPNGAGKTTILNVITRVFDAHAGTILVGDTDITRAPRHTIVRHGVARTFQNIELFERATVMDNLLVGRHQTLDTRFWTELFNLPSVQRAEADARRRIEDIIDLLALAPYRSTPVGALPYGIRKVVELARALAAEPKLLLLDEPASGLNPEERRDLGFWIEDIRAEMGATIVMIEHDMALVEQVSDHVLVMNQGMVLAQGSAAEIRGNPLVTEAYLGAAPSLSEGEAVRV